LVCRAMIDLMLAGEEAKVEKVEDVEAAVGEA
jgi:hypothetical protein